ncbi:hypothetical protein D9611_003382 [Ephemerocybe angulata]|uniref:Uncharacterized protein n=1 Tax=Ephemerocybe angulata TaxID=980116 RepID=A0A8H5FI24_9AGAR|nr:hypothetical protein D9611_003382 [Tulosesus angulatus]
MDIARRRGSTFVLSPTKSHLVEVSSSKKLTKKRAGKRPLYYSYCDTISGPPPRDSFQYYLQLREALGEVAFYSDSSLLSPEDKCRVQRFKRREDKRRLETAIARVAAEERLERRLTTIILDFVHAIRHAQRTCRPRY